MTDINERVKRIKLEILAGKLWHYADNLLNGFYDIMNYIDENKLDEVDEDVKDLAEDLAQFRGEIDKVREEFDNIDRHDIGIIKRFKIGF